jgi:hypothetical protein
MRRSICSLTDDVLTFWMCICCRKARREEDIKLISNLGIYSGIAAAAFLPFIADSCNNGFGCGGDSFARFKIGEKGGGTSRYRFPSFVKGTGCVSAIEISCRPGASDRDYTLASDLFRPPFARSHLPPSRKLQHDPMMNSLRRPITMYKWCLHLHNDSNLDKQTFPCLYVDPVIMQTPFNLSLQTRLLIIIVISTSFFAIELTVGFYTHSLALIADTFHYIGDVLGFVVGWWVLRVSSIWENPTSRPDIP